MKSIGQLEKQKVLEIECDKHNLNEAYGLQPTNRTIAFCKKLNNTIERSFIDLGKLNNPDIRRNKQAYDLGIDIYYKVKDDRRN